VGSAFGDSLIGSAASNRIVGGAGADWLVGGGGNDTFVQFIDTTSIDRLFGGAPGADSGIDTIDYSGASAGVIVQLSGYASTNAGAGSITLATFSGIEDAIGTAFNDALIGNTADNLITGGAGADWLVGGAGNDVFLQSPGLGSGLDRLFGDAGVDTVDYSGASVGVFVQLSDDVFAPQGGVLGPAIAELSGVENVVGSAFMDTLFGDAADNVIVGGASRDFLVGGGGADRFVFQAVTDGDDRIDDFSHGDGDKIDLSAMDANPFLAGDQAFAFSTSRTPGLIGEAVVFSSSPVGATVFLYLDTDDNFDFVIDVHHQFGQSILGQADFVL
jgi:Ca2+-binding RTX toxin-like protein